MSRKQQQMMRLLRHLFIYIFKHPKILWILLPFMVLLYLYEVTIARPKMVYMGVPQSQSWQPKHWSRVLRNDDFMLGYSDYLGNPLWVSYRLSRVSDEAKRYNRPQRFQSDWRTLTQVGHTDYSGSGYDRGHMAPNWAMSRLYGRDTQMDTFVMSNITPQKPALNQKLWRRLEVMEVEAFVPRFDLLWVMTGTIFDGDTSRLSSSYKVKIPSGFFKIYIGVKAGKPIASLALIIPQNVRGNEALQRFVTSIDEVERRTGMDYFHLMEDSVEQELEARHSEGDWFGDA